jgi:hypothetical protein
VKGKGKSILSYNSHHLFHLHFFIVNSPFFPYKEQRLPSDLEMTWMNYSIPVVTSSVLMFSCWLVGHFQCSLLWIFLFIALYVLKTHTWIRREQKRISLRNVILRERDIVMAHYSRADDLPAWVQFPDIERIEWINKVYRLQGEMGFPISASGNSQYP